MRWEYITKIRQFLEEGRYIVYVDETWYDTHDLVKKGPTDWTENCYLQGTLSRGKRIITPNACDNCYYSAIKTEYDLDHYTVLSTWVEISLRFIPSFDTFHYTVIMLESQTV